MALTTNPQPLGRLLPGAPFATTVVQAISNITALLSAPYQAYELVIQADRSNNNAIIITNNASVPAADSSNVLAELNAREKFELHSYSGAGQVDVRNIYVAALDADDFAIGYLREL